MKFLRPYITYATTFGFFLAVTLPFTSIPDLIASSLVGIGLLVIYKLAPALKRLVVKPQPGVQARPRPKVRRPPHPDDEWLYINRICPLSLAFGASIAVTVARYFELTVDYGIIIFAVIACATQEFCKRKLNLA